MNKRKKLGQDGENLVSKYLSQKGFAIVAQNYRKRYGEIDLIAQKKDLIVFVEVKRRSKRFFDMCQLITFSKQKKIILVAKEYIARYGHDQKVCRFDVALIEGDRITYLPNAFTEGESNGCW